MRKPDPVQTFPCMVPPRHARLVEHPHDELPARRSRRLRGLAERLRLVRRDPRAGE